MLESTFQHISGVGEKSERSLWSAGFTSWQSILDGGCRTPSSYSRRLRAGVLESVGRLSDGDHAYFRERLGGPLSWRAYSAFRGDACFLDIETTGLSPEHDEVTTVCVHSPRETRAFVAGQNLGDLEGFLEGFKFIATFNGARFDLPFLSRRLGLCFPQIHLDLMYPLRRLGFSGGLKGVEARLGLERDSAGVTGFDAVRLWRSFRSGRPVEVAGRRVCGGDALDLLLEYNREDAVNLEFLCDFVVGELTASCRRRMP